MTLSLLRKPGKFIPTPSGECSHAEILSGVKDFLRKYQWTFFTFSGSDSRFHYKSKTFPPAHLVPFSTRNLFSSILLQCESFLSNCTHCFPADNLTSCERKELSRLASANSFTVSPVDKGSAWMVLPTTVHIMKQRLFDN